MSDTLIMERPLQWRLDLFCHIRKEEDAIFSKCSGTDIMKITQHKNIFSAQPTCVIQTVNGFGWQGATLWLCLFRTNGLCDVSQSSVFESMERNFDNKEIWKVSNQPFTNYKTNIKSCKENEWMNLLQLRTNFQNLKLKAN